MVDAKYILDHPNEMQRFAGEIVHLVDETTGTFKTNCLEDFAKFSKNVDTANKAINCYASPTEVKAFVGQRITRYTAPSAVLVLTTHPRLQLLLNANKLSLSLAEVEELLRRLRSGLDEAGKEVLLKSRDLKISKKLEVEQKRDRSGNGTYSMKMESGVDDWSIPETVRIRVPAFDFIEDEIELPFDFSLSFTAIDTKEEKKHDVFFKLECLDIEEHLLNGRRDIILRKMEESGLPTSWGSLNLNVADNAWALVHNRAESLERLR